MNILIKKCIAFGLSVAILLFLCSCRADLREYKKEIYALDTVITLTAYGENAEQGINAAASEINRLEKLFSVTNPDSDISKINASAGEYVKVQSETVEIISRALEISAATDGAFDISIYPVVTLWGFTTGNYGVPNDTKLAQALSFVNYKNIDVSENSVRILQGMSLDLGGIAKGYISNRITDILKENGVACAVINLGGNVQTLGSRYDGNDWRIGIKNPYSSDNFAVIRCGESSVVTSGAYQRNFTENGIVYHHIIDTRSGYPADSGIASSTVISRDAALADALSTAFYVLGVEKAEQIADILDVDYIILTSQGKIFASERISENIEIF